MVDNREGEPMRLDEMERVVAHAKDVPYVRRVVSYLTLKARSREGS